MNVVALMIGRGGSSLKDKNILPVLGVPLLLWSAAAARRSRYIKRFYISSDCPRILETAALASYLPIKRPAVLANDTAQSCDAVRHALDHIDAEGAADIVLVQHANVGTITEHIIDRCIEELIADPSLSAAVPCHDAADHHPLRGKGVDAEGLLQPFVTNAGMVSANRQELPPCLFFDHSIWALQSTAIRDQNGQSPWPCMGTRIKPILTEGCFDVHTLADLKTTEQWILDNRVPRPSF